MKNFVFIFIAFAFFSSSAQKIITSESEETFRNGQRNAVCATIYRKDLKNIINQWQVYLKQFKYETVTELRGEVYGHNLFFKNILNRPVDIYTRFELTPDTITKMKCAIDIGASNYLKSSENGPEVKEQEKIVRDFAVKMSKAPMEELLAASNAKRDECIKERVEMEKDIKEAKANLIDYDKKLIKLQKDSLEKSVLFKNKNVEVESQKKVMDTITVKESDFAKSSKKTIDKLNAQRSDIDSDIAGVNEKITAYRKKINTANTDIKVNGEFILKGIKEIENQKIIAEDLKKRLEQIN